MSQNSGLNLSMQRFGLQFAAKETEEHFRDWRIDDAIPFIRFGMAAAILNWIALTVSFYALFPDQASTLFYLGFGAAIPSILVAFALTWATTMRRLVFPVTALANTITGTTLVWIGHEIWVLPSFMAITPYMASSCVIIMFFAFTVFRLPFLTACLAVFPYLSLTIFFMFSDYRLGNVAGVEVGTSAVTLFTGFFSGVIICCILSIITRRNYVQKQTLNQQQRLIRRYVPPAVSEQIIAGKEADIAEPKRQRITVLFSDIVGFTDMADRLDAESLTQILNEYMSAMAGIVEAHNGTLNEFAGDGLMALFGAPKELSPEDQVLHAVQAAQEMQALLPELNNGWRKLGIGEPLQIRVGINTGVLSVGSFGSEGRMTYTAIGLQTNIASRIESKAEPGEILISDASYQLIGEHIDCELRGEVECKGVHFPVKVYAPPSSAVG